MLNIFFKFRHCVNDAHQNSCKIDQNSLFLQISHLSSNRRVCNFALYFQSTTPARKLTHRTKFEHPGRHKFGHARFLHYLEPEKCQNLPRNSTNFGHAMFLRYLEPEKCQNLPRNSTNFSHAIILHYLEPAKCQKSTKKTRILYKLHSLTPTTMPRKVLVFHNFSHCLKCIH